MSFTRIAIVNRGEPAVRLINAVGEYNLEHDAELTTIALYTEPDRRALFVRLADEAYDLGPPTFADERGQRQVSYLDYERLEAALVATRADAAWVGWGFVAEQAAFVELCDRLGVTFIGPSAEVMRKLGDKISSKLIAEAADVPVAPWSGGPVHTVDEARTHATRLGYPLLIKASSGGGGRGIRRIEGPEDLDAAFDSARAEALGAFGDDTVFLETLVPQAKHIEVQIIGDSAGTVWPVGVRDCSVQRRNQKLLEEAPSPALTPAQHKEIGEAAARLGAAAGYQNAGTVEFLYEPETSQFAFMEVNARLQVEHPVTELTTGVDMVKLQIHVAQGGRLAGEPPATVGHAIEARVNAEDADAGFTPAPGHITLLRLPMGPGLRIDTGVDEGDEIAPEFDSMIAKVIATGRDRAEALSRLRRGLAQTAIVIRNGTSNKAFLQALLEEPEVTEATADVGWVDRLSKEGTQLASHHGDVAIVAAALSAHGRQMQAEIDQFRASALRGRPDVKTSLARSINLRHRGQAYATQVYQLAPDRHRVVVDGCTIDVCRRDQGRSMSRLEFGDLTYRVLASMHGVTHQIEVDGEPHRVADDEGGIIRSPAPAVVVSIDVAPGDEVTAGDRLAVIEAMKMETAIVAEFNGRVREIAVQNNAQVNAGSPLMTLEPTQSDGEQVGDRVQFDALGAAGELSHDTCSHYFDAVRQMLLGYDVAPASLDSMAAGKGTPCPESLPSAVLRAHEQEVLSIFADIAALFRRAPIDELEELTRRTSEEYLFDYLRSLETRGEDLPDEFMDQLRRTLTHYGITSLDPSPALEGALFRIAVSHHRMGEQLGPILGVLESWLGQPVLTGDEHLRTLLERVVAESRHQHPAVHDLARELHSLVFDQPFLEEIRDRVYQDVVRQLDRLDEGASGDERAQLVAALVDCPQPLKTYLSDRFDGASVELRSALLEVMTRRYYRIRDVENLTVIEAEGRQFASGEYDHEGKRVHLLTTHLAYDDLAAAATAARALATAIDTSHDVVVDFYVSRPELVSDPDVLRDELAASLAGALGAEQLRRIVVAISGPDSDVGTAGVMHFTFRPDGEGGYREEALYRDLHPMMGKRLELWRLEQFDIQRLPTPEGVYLFHGRARENPRDERLFALAEIRDLTPIRDEAGTIQRLPEAERVFHEVQGAIRRFQAHRPPHRRLHWNRVFLYVWPTLELTTADITRVVQRLVADAEGLGLERVQLRAPVRVRGDDQPRRRVFEVTELAGEARVRVRKPPKRPLRPLGPYEQKVVRLRQRGLTYPYELIRTLTPKPGQATPGLPAGHFTEYDLEGDKLVPVDRPYGNNTANIVAGVITNTTDRYPDGMRRVMLLGDPSRGMGNLAEPECSRINAALDLAEELGVPLEWFAVSAGALISMDSGVENMDWIGRVLRRIIEFTQAGGEINIVVAGINVGAQPYWNAEATMLMHTKGILVMTPESAMVLTGKQALDYSGGVSAEDNQGIGGYERIMGPNGQAQYFARDLSDACRVLLHHYEYTYVAPGERFPRRAATSDPVDRDVSDAPHGGDFQTVGEVFSEDTNPGRKQPFEIRRIMAAAVDRDRPTLERWYGMLNAEIGVVWDAFLGGYPVCMIGFEAKNFPRPGFVPADGPDYWTSGTLFPSGSKKVARAVNAATNNRPLVVLANLSGFDGSPESMRERQLEFGAEIGRAVVNFVGPIVFCVVSRYHGGAFVVFSNTLNDNMEVAAVEGAAASVIGGAPAAAVVFARDVQKRTMADPRVSQLEQQAREAHGGQRVELLGELDRVREQVHAEKLGEVADEFDAKHDVHRAQRMGAVHKIIEPERLRPYLIDAIERGMERELS